MAASGVQSLSPRNGSYQYPRNASPIRIRLNLSSISMPDSIAFTNLRHCAVLGSTIVSLEQIEYGIYTFLSM